MLIDRLGGYGRWQRCTQFERLSPLATLAALTTTIFLGAAAVVAEENPADTQPAPAPAETNTTGKNSKTAVDIESVTVIGRRIEEEKQALDYRAPQLLTLEMINQKQPDSLFDLIKDVPGVSLEGGPRPNGTSISIRGMSSNEDVLITLDGAVKNFTKYRFGGTFIEPELLKQVEIFRGPASLTQGAGVAGGVVAMETKNASDLLLPDQDFGAMMKYGYASNNHENLALLAAYARLGDQGGILVSGSQRESDDFKLGNGQVLPRSAVEPKTQLFKLNGGGDHWRAALTLSHYNQSGREYYDTNANRVSGGSLVDSEVYRRTDDRTLAFMSRYVPDNDWVDLQLNYGYTKTNVNEEHLKSDGVTGDFLYRIQYLTLLNKTPWTLGEFSGRFTYGAQARKEQRDSSSDAATQMLRDAIEKSQPSGETGYRSGFVLSDWYWRNWQLGLGYREDHYHAESTQPGILDQLHTFGQEDTIDNTESVLNYSVAYRFDAVPVKLHANRVEAARPPKIDEYFSQAPYGFAPCLASGTFGAMPAGIAIGWGQKYPALPAPYNASGICGDLYQAQRSVSTEIGIETEVSDLLFADDVFRAELTAFENQVEHTLSSLRMNPADSTGQPGEQTYRGTEAEIDYRLRGWQLHLTYSAMDAHETQYFLQGAGKIGNPSRRVWQTQPTYTIPGDLLALDLSWTSADERWQFGGKATHRGSWYGLIPVSADLNVPDKQSAYTEYQLYSYWRPWDETRFQLTIDNATDVAYRLPGGFAGTLGNYNVGRNIKFSWTQRFGW